jgi:hypothetical protein
MLMAPFRNITVGFFLLLAITGATIGQNNGSTKCPTISVTGPAGVWSPGEEISFSVNLEGVSSAKLMYLWSVNKGRIAKGQGTKTIAVTTPKGSYQPIEATVEVSGIAAGCPKLASETATMVIDAFDPILLGDVTSPTYRIPNTLLRIIKRSMQNSYLNKYSQLYVALHIRNPLSVASVGRLQSDVIRQLATTGIDTSRFTIIPTLSRHQGLTFWQVPPGRSNPSVVRYIP